MTHPYPTDLERDRPERVPEDEDIAVPRLDDVTDDHDEDGIGDENEVSAETDEELLLAERDLDDETGETDASGAIEAQDDRIQGGDDGLRVDPATTAAAGAPPVVGAIPADEVDEVDETADRPDPQLTDVDSIGDTFVDDVRPDDVRTDDELTTDVIVGELVDEDDCASPAADEQVVNGEHIVDGQIVAPVTAVGGLRPGDAPAPAVVADPAGREALRTQWQQAQLSFIDDPHAAADTARGIVAAAVKAHIETLQARQAELDAWQDESAPDTEILRGAMQGYRDLVTTLTGE